VVVLEVETPIETYRVTVTVVDDKGFTVEGAEVRVNLVESGRTDRYGVVQFDLPAGTYTARAKKTIDTEVWGGEATFTVPYQLEVRVVLTAPVIPWETLMWVGIAGVAVVAGVVVVREVSAALRGR